VTGCRPNNHCLVLTFPPHSNQLLDPPSHLSNRGVWTWSQRVKPSASRKSLIFKFQLCCNLSKSYTIPVVVLTWRERTFTLIEHVYAIGNFLVSLINLRQQHKCLSEVYCEARHKDRKLKLVQVHFIHWTRKENPRGE